MKLGLGTAQFGMDYGISGTSRQVAETDVRSILKRAKAAGIDTLDTAAGYGKAESVLGRLDAGDPEAGWRVITKLPGLPAGICEDDVSEWCKDQLNGILGRLNAPWVSGLLLHRPYDLLGRRGAALAAALVELKAQGLCQTVGISLYGPQDLEALEKGIVPFDMLPLDLVQIPCSPLDQRLEQSGWAERLCAQKTRIHLRSVFLQGLLLMSDEIWPTYFQSHAEPLKQWCNWLRDTEQSPLAAALRFALSRSYAERVIIGVDSVEQLQNNLVAATHDGPIPPPSLATTNIALLDPRDWPSS